MGYIICAECELDDEDNHGAVIEDVNARILNKEKDKITFDVRGDFSNNKEITKNLCLSLIDAGFLAFEIRHSY